MPSGRDASAGAGRDCRSSDARSSDGSRTAAASLRARSRSAGPTSVGYSRRSMRPQVGPARRRCCPPRRAAPGDRGSGGRGGGPPQIAATPRPACRSNRGRARSGRRRRSRAGPRSCRGRSPARCCRRSSSGRGRSRRRARALISFSSAAHASNVRGANTGSCLSRWMPSVFSSNRRCAVLRFSRLARPPPSRAARPTASGFARTRSRSVSPRARTRCARWRCASFGKSIANAWPSRGE